MMTSRSTTARALTCVLCGEERMFRELLASMLAAWNILVYFLFPNDR